MLLVGSHAASYYFDNYREPKKYDVLISELEGSNIEINNFKNNDNFRLIKVSKHSPISTLISKNQETLVKLTGFGEVFIADIETLYILKRCFIHYSQNWKHDIEDIILFRSRMIPFMADDSYAKIFKLIYKSVLDGEDAYGSMKVLNETFFQRFKHSFIRIYAHDKLHAVTCYYDEPLYRTLKPDLEQAYIDPRKFGQLKHSDKIRLVREEAYAIALERVIIPSTELKIPINEEKAYRYAVYKICTDATRGWFRNFAVDNYAEVIKYDTDYLKRFHDAVISGFLVKKINTTEENFIKNLDLYMKNVTKIIALEIN